MKIPKLSSKKIVVFTNYRCGSSRFCNELSTKNNISPDKCLGEYFGWSFKGTNYEISYDKLYRNLTSYTKFCLKLMADQVEFNPIKISNILDKADTVVYLYRKNFIKQASSYIAAKMTNSFSVGYEEDDVHNNDIHVPFVHEYVSSKLTNVLKNNYKMMGEMYKNYPGPIYCLEDLLADSLVPYKKTIIWTNNIEIEPYDIEQTLSQYGMVRELV